MLYLFQFATIMLAEFRRPSKAVAWLSILFMFPLVGFVMYYFLAQEYRQRTVVRRRKHRAAADEENRSRLQALTIRSVDEFPNPRMREQARLFGLCQSFAHAPITRRNKLQVFESAEAFYSHMLERISQAKDHVHFVYYIWNDDDIGRTFKQALIRKALEGVRVRVIYDGIGCYGTPNAFWNELRAAGAGVKCFLPAWVAFFDKRINYRNHRKVAVIDGLYGYIGGINIGDEYLGKDRKLGYWRDTCLHLEGDGVYGLQLSFFRDWQFVSEERLSHRNESYFPKHNISEVRPVQIVPDGPDTDVDAIQEILFSAFTAARERIYLTTPYFIPDRSIIMALKTAALSGIDVRIVLPGVADSRLVQWASLSFIEEMMQAGVKIYRYQKGFMHAKVMVVDGHFAAVGTANMDLRSFYSNFEIIAAVFDQETIHRLGNGVLTDMEDSREVLLADFLKRSRLEKAQEAVGRLLSPLL